MKPFNELELNGKPLSDCELALECNNDLYRLYVDKHPDDTCFYAMAVEFVSGVDGPGSGDGVWECDDILVSVILEATAFFDGVRHLDCGDVYYPNMLSLITIMQKLIEIEAEVCEK